MSPTYRAPGVYREDAFLKPQQKLATGVPGFVGFVDGASATAVQRAVVLQRKEDLATLFSFGTSGYLNDAVAGFFDNGGLRCYVVGVSAATNPAAALSAAVSVLAPVEDLDLVAVPDAMLLLGSDGRPDRSAVLQVQAEVLQHCAENGNRFAILDSLPGANLDDVLEQRRTLAVGQAEPLNAALYYPWLRTSERLVPPSGHVAGIFARSDARVGVFKAPANEVLQGVVDVETDIDVPQQEQLNSEGVNCLRAFPGRGIRVWGARTLSRHPNWRYVSVRRLFLTLRRWIDANMAWAVFEPNGPALWVRIHRELGGYLEELLRLGALRGQSPREAFFVKCDAETNPAEVRDAGQVVTEIGLAPLTPAEFIVVRILHRPSTESVS